LGSWGFENDVIFAHICRWIHRKLQIEIRCCRWLGTCILYGQGSLFLCGDFSHGEGKYFSTKLRIFFLKVEFLRKLSYELLCIACYRWKYGRCHVLLISCISHHFHPNITSY
jgi:hypothetical protein